MGCAGPISDMSGRWYDMNDGMLEESIHFALLWWRCR
jgi:hypothetical protein